jgi:hypothetical protein
VPFPRTVTDPCRRRGCGPGRGSREGHGTRRFAGPTRRGEDRESEKMVLVILPEQCRVLSVNPPAPDIPA